MTKPSDFILTTDYATLKNDNKGSVSITLPSAILIPAAGIYSQSASIPIGVRGSSFRSRISSTKRTEQFVTNTVVYSYSSGATVIGSPTNYDIFVTVTRANPTSLTLSVTIPNGFADPMSVTGLAQTITANVATFLPPF